MPSAKKSARRKPLGRRKLSKNRTNEDQREATRDDIIAAATREFTECGFEGTRINAVIRRTRTSSRMTYYHFRDKEGLYKAVLEAAYKKMFVDPLAVDVLSDPFQALRKFAEAYFEKMCSNEDFVRLIMIENIRGAGTVSASRVAHDLGRRGIKLLSEIVARGQALGLFRKDVETSQVYFLITSQSYHSMANQHTVRELFGFDIKKPRDRAKKSQMIADAACRYVAAKTNYD